MQMMKTVNPHLQQGLPRHYGWVVFAGTGAVFVNHYLSMKVMSARKRFGVEYPEMYSKDSKEFNCIQRSHQNYLENMPFFYFLLVFGGFQAPKCCAACGVIYLAGCIVYAQGYSTGDPKKRMRGAFGYMGILTLLLNTVVIGGRMIKAGYDATK